MRQAAYTNGRTLPDDFVLRPVSSSEGGRGAGGGGNLLELFRSRHMAAKTLILYVNWFANSFVYYGLTLNTGSLGGSFLVNFVVSGLLEIPGYGVALFVILKV